eukprot:UN09208
MGVTLGLWWWLLSGVSEANEEKVETITFENNEEGDAEITIKTVPVEKGKPKSRVT